MYIACSFAYKENSGQQQVSVKWFQEENCNVKKTGGQMLKDKL
jgi:hypothetical protein